MFTTLGLFDSLPCLDKHACTRVNCIFSHRPGLSEQSLRVHADIPLPSDPPASASSSSIRRPSADAVPAKRPISTQLNFPGRSTHDASPSEPPRKLQRTGPVKRPVPVPTATHTSTGVPIIRVPAAQSQVAIPVRQAMLKSLYEHFLVLYDKILPSNPTLASEHALRQEQEVYERSNKLTYRNAVISSIAALKRRPFPDNAGHPSIGTEADIAARAETRKKLEALRLTAEQLEPYVLSVEEMRRWGYIVDVPEGVGGGRPSELGAVKTCERCTRPFVVKGREEAGLEGCVFHWGRQYSAKANGEKRRLWSCCSQESDSEGCERGPHVFYDSTPEDLHLRHPFSFTRAPSSSNTLLQNASSSDLDANGASSSATASSVHTDADTALDVVALDCEMVYTTGGMRVARVSVVDSAGKEVFDELVRMDDGVEVLDFNTRFSGITSDAYTAGALLPLASIRQSLDALISARTVIIGHALENDLKTLRMVHHRCVDTVVLFPHPMGAPYRRALRTLVKEHLGQTIQAGGGTVGHSSVEDSVATLDLVRWHVLNRPKPQAKAAEAASVT